MMHYPMLEIFGSASPVVITAFFSLRSSLASVYNVYFFVEAVFSILEQLVGFYQ
jgi:hypothetical protein